MQAVSASAQQPELKVIPAEITVGEEGQPIPADPIIVNVTVADVEGLYAWQVKIYYNPDVLIWTDAWYPDDHVFAGMTFQSVDPTSGTDAGGTYILYFASLIGEVFGFNGTGTLCQLNFTAKAAGTSALEIDATPPAPWSWLQNSDLEFIEFQSSNGVIYVIPEFQYVLVPLFLISTTMVIIANKKIKQRKLLDSH
jgi:hypothetical protein